MSLPTFTTKTRSGRSVLIPRRLYGSFLCTTEYPDGVYINYEGKQVPNAEVNTEKLSDDYVEEDEKAFLFF